MADYAPHSRREPQGPVQLDVQPAVQAWVEGHGGQAGGDGAQGEDGGRVEVGQNLDPQLVGQRTGYAALLQPRLGIECRWLEERWRGGRYCAVHMANPPKRDDAIRTSVQTEKVPYLLVMFLRPRWRRRSAS